MELNGPWLAAMRKITREGITLETPRFPDSCLTQEFVWLLLRKSFLLGVTQSQAELRISPGKNLLGTVHKASPTEVLNYVNYVNYVIHPRGKLT